MYPHRIRLRGPWEAEPLDPPGPERRVTLPARVAECGLGDARRVLFRRRFGRPRQIDAHERAWLIGEGLSGHAGFQLNGQSLGEHAGDAGPFAFPMTDLLAERNELAIELTADGPGGGLWGDVAIEIRCRAYLQDVRTAVVDGFRVRISGEVVGEADGPLDVYALADERTIGYQLCSAGTSFEIVTDELTTMPPEVRVELVNGAVNWWTVDLAVR
jgi:hypothetical protein